MGYMKMNVKEIGNKGNKTWKQEVGNDEQLCNQR